MRVLMLLARRYQDAGTERPLDRGQSYELPDAVAQSLIATGAAKAESVGVGADDDQADAEPKSMRPPGGRPMLAPERKSPLRRAS